MGKVYEGSEVARWERWESNEVAREEARGVMRKWGTQGDFKI